MDILKKLFGLPIDDSNEQPDIVFGRYTDAYKESAKYKAWDDSMKAFESEEYTKYFENFFYYLRDEDSANVTYNTTEGITYFEIYQGSKLLVGTANRSIIRVECKIAKTENLNIGLLRRLLELNFTLKYAKYALDNNEWITMIFDAKTRDTNPYKLYYGLKELALNSDKQDDILESEFDSLQAINNSHIKTISDEEKRVKYDYLQSQIERVLDIKEKSILKLDNFPGAISYLCLDAIYRLDYLLKPEGFTMERFEKMHRVYFENNKESPGQKNVNLLNDLSEVKNRSFDELEGELYEVVSTFGITQPSSHDRLVEFIKQELPNVQFYESNNHHRIAQSIYNYIVGYCLFNYSLPSPDKSFLHLYFMVIENQYFSALGFTQQLLTEGKLEKNNILLEIKKIVNLYQDEYGVIKPDTSQLKFKSPLEFSKSYLLMLSTMHLSPSKSINN